MMSFLFQVTITMFVGLFLDRDDCSKRSLRITIDVGYSCPERELGRDERVLTVVVLCRFLF